MGCLAEGKSTGGLWREMRPIGNQKERRPQGKMLTAIPRRKRTREAGPCKAHEERGNHSPQAASIPPSEANGCGVELVGFQHVPPIQWVANPCHPCPQSPVASGSIKRVRKTDHRKRSGAPFPSVIGDLTSTCLRKFCSLNSHGSEMRCTKLRGFKRIERERLGELV
jgi:hypothetical protein